jgi:hypothetical protein
MALLGGRSEPWFSCTPAMFTKDVDRTKLASRFGEHALDIGGFRGVALDRCCLAAGSVIFSAALSATP